MNYLDYWYKPYDLEAEEFNEQARISAENRDRSNPTELNEKY